MSATDNVITANDLMGMVTHNLNTPPNGYLGSDYGVDIKQLLQNPSSAVINSDAVIDKIVSDVPILSALPDGSVSLYMQTKAGTIDQQTLVISVAGSNMAIGNIGNTTS